MRMLDIGRAVAEQWNESGGKRSRDREIKAFLPVDGAFTSRKDYSIKWPEEGESVLVIEYHPDRASGLIDPRYRVIEYDLKTGEYEVADQYPTTIKVVMFGLVGLFAGVSYLLLRLGMKPLQKSFGWDGRMAAKKAGDELEAIELIARMRNRET